MAGRSRSSTPSVAAEDAAAGGLATVEEWPWIPEAPTPPPVAPPRKVKKSREGAPLVASLVLGFLAAAISTALWAIVGPYDERVAGYLGPLVGVAVGTAVRWRAHKSSVARPITAVSITGVSVVLGQFAVENNIEDGTNRIPNLSDFSQALTLVQKALEERPFIMLVWLAAIVVAGALASQADEL
jgi:hypothetical protein